MTTPPAPAPVDVLVIGGSAAGLAAALSLGRSRRTVRVLDAGEPRNATSAHAHNLLTRDGTPPAELLATARTEVARYGVEVVTARAVDARAVAGDASEPCFEVRTADGLTHRARRLVLATGMRDVLPDVPGLAARWGRDALHCPYCHGWEVRDRALAVLATGPRAVHLALLVRQLSADVTLLLHDTFEPGDDERTDLAARGVRVVPGRVTGVRVADDTLTGLAVEGGGVVPCDAVFVGSRAVLDDALVGSLGLATTTLDMLGEDVGRAVDVDPTGVTSVPGVWAAGNVTGPQHALASSIAAGSLAGAHVNASLVTADVARDVAHGAAQDTAQGTAQDADDELDPAWWEERYRAHDRVWSGHVNPSLAQVAADLTPGTALDAGAGEGADAVWLAERGWRVTAVDASRTALDRGAAQAAARGLDVTWQQADLRTWSPPTRYDLVTSHYLHAEGGRGWTWLADAVAPGGTLLVVGHDPSDLDGPVPRPHLARLGHTADQVAADLDPAQWETIDPRVVERAHRHDGADVPVRDAVLVARRR